MVYSSLLTTQLGIFFLVQFLFKKYLDYEKQHGDESRVEHVKNKAMEYVDTKLG